MRGLQMDPGPVGRKRRCGAPHRVRDAPLRKSGRNARAQANQIGPQWRLERYRELHWTASVVAGIAEFGRQNAHDAERLDRLRQVGPASPEVTTDDVWIGVEAISP